MIESIMVSVIRRLADGVESSHTIPMRTTSDVCWLQATALLRSARCRALLRFRRIGYLLVLGLLPLTSAGTTSDTGATVREGRPPEPAGRGVADGSPFSLDRYQWQKRLLVVSAPGQDDQQLREQLDAVSAARGPFEERDMVLVILVNDGASTADGQALTSDEVAAARSELEISPDSFALRLIGKDGGIKLASGDTVPMEEIYALIDTMPMRRREMEER